MVHDGRSLKGRSNEAICSACLYIACRQEGVPRTFKEIVAVSVVSKKEIGRCFKLILKAHDTNVDIIQTGDFMHRFCATLGLSRDVQKAATHIAKKSVDLDIVPGKIWSNITGWIGFGAKRDFFLFRSITHICRSGCHLYGIPSIKPKENSARDSRHSWCGWRNDPPVLQANAAKSISTLPWRFQFCHTHWKLTCKLKCLYPYKRKQIFEWSSKCDLFLSAIIPLVRLNPCTFR